MAPQEVAQPHGHSNLPGWPPLIAAAHDDCLANAVFVQHPRCEANAFSKRTCLGLHFFHHGGWWTGLLAWNIKLAGIVAHHRIHDLPLGVDHPSHQHVCDAQANV